MRIILFLVFLGLCIWAGKSFYQTLPPAAVVVESPADSTIVYSKIESPGIVEKKEVAPLAQAIPAEEAMPLEPIEKLDPDFVRETLLQAQVEIKQAKEKLRVAATAEEYALLQFEIFHRYAFTPLVFSEIAEEKAMAEAALKEAYANYSENEPLRYGDVIHYANLILGRIALRAGDMEKAKFHLKRAGETPGSPTLNTFGPNFMLAKELLLKNEKQAVLNYIDACLVFWRMANNRPLVWKASIAKNEIPEFGRNLFD